MSHWSTTLLLVKSRVPSPTHWIILGASIATVLSRSSHENMPPVRHLHNTLMPLLVDSDLERSINLNSPQTPRRPPFKPRYVDTRLLELFQHLVNLPLSLQVVAAEFSVVVARFVVCCPVLVGWQLAFERFAEFEEARGC